MAKSKPLPRGIDERRTGQYRVRVSYQGRQHTIGVYDTRAFAETALERAKGQMVLGQFVPPSEQRAKKREAERLAAEQAAVKAYTVQDLAADYLTRLEERGRTTSTVYTYRRRIERHILPALGHLPARDVTPADITRWHATLVCERGYGVARPCYLTLSAMYSWATGKGEAAGFTPLVDVSPVRIPRADKHVEVRRVDRKVATPDELAAIAEAMPDRDRLTVLLAGWCGLRIGEVLALRRGDFDLSSGNRRARAWLTVQRQVQAKGGGLYETQPKSGRAVRTVPIPDMLVPTIRQHLAAHVATGAHSLVFPRTDYGADWTHPNTLRARFNQARDAMNRERRELNQPTLEGFTFHMCRHTALTRAGEAGATLAELQDLAGHADAATAMKYQHSSRNRLAALADRMAEGVTMSTGDNVHQLRISDKTADSTPQYG